MNAAKTLALAASLAFAASRAQALIDVSAFGGYSTVNMADVNDVLTKSASGRPVTLISSGFYAGANVGITVLPFLKVGPRVEYLQVGQGKVGVDTVDTNLMSYELGLSVDTALPLTGLSIMGGAWGGYGMAYAKVADPAKSEAETANGSGFVANVAAELRYKLVAGFSIGLDLGYRLANVTNMNADKTQAEWGSTAGKPLFTKGSSTDAANFDYSGLNAGGALNFNF